MNQSDVSGNATGFAKSCGQCLRLGVTPQGFRRCLPVSPSAGFVLTCSVLERGEGVFLRNSFVVFAHRGHSPGVQVIPTQIDRPTMARPVAFQTQRAVAHTIHDGGSEPAFGFLAVGHVHCEPG